MSRATATATAPEDLRTYLRGNQEALALLDTINWQRLPRHVAVIMDGNGRWAEQRDMSRVEGHREGITAVREVVETATRAGIEVLTLYAFSVENWKRPQAEIDTLMELLKEYLARELPTLLEQSIRFEAIGRLGELPEDVQRDVRDATEATQANTGMRFVIALNYGGRSELVDACRNLARKVQGGELAPDDIDEAELGQELYTRGLPDPDLLIRTSGELRISNFLLYQVAYAEIWVTDKLWPDFRRADLLRAIIDFQRRERRYGSVDSETD